MAGSVAAGLGSSWAKQVLGNKPPNVGRPVRVSVDVQRKVGRIPSDFVGLGYEISSVAIPDLFSSSNRTYVQLVKTLSASSVIRIGGNTSDYSMFAPEKDVVSAPKGTVVNTASLRQLGTFLDATNWRLIWGLNLGGTDERQAVSEAEAVMAAVKEKLLAFEIGNEPDLFGRGTAHRPKSYNYESFLEEFRRYKAAIRAKIPKAPFAGPDAASATDWVTRFVADEGSDLKLLTHHYYRECTNPSSTAAKLLHVDPKLGPELATLRAASTSSKVPYRICETNSFCGGGKPGVSDTFAAALWVLDFMYLLAHAGCGGVNIETGVNHIGFVSSYSPIGQDEHGTYFATPEYYGMLAFAQASDGQLIEVDCDSAGANVSAYAVAGERSSLAVTIINKDEVLDAEVSLSIPKELADGEVLRLSAPSLQSKEGTTFGGAAVSASGRWQPEVTEILHSRDGNGWILLPAGSAAVLKWGT